MQQSKIKKTDPDNQYRQVPAASTQILKHYGAYPYGEGHEGGETLRGGGGL